MGHPRGENPATHRRRDCDQASAVECREQREDHGAVYRDFASDRNRPGPGMKGRIPCVSGARRTGPLFGGALPKLPEAAVSVGCQVAGIIPSAPTGVSLYLLPYGSAVETGHTSWEPVTARSGGLSDRQSSSRGRLCRCRIGMHVRCCCRDAVVVSVVNPWGMSLPPGEVSPFPSEGRAPCVRLYRQCRMPIFSA